MLFQERLIGIPAGVGGGSKRQGNDASFILLWEIRDLYSHSKALTSPAAEKPIQLTMSPSHGALWPLSSRASPRTVFGKWFFGAILM